MDRSPPKERFAPRSSGTISGSQTGVVQQQIYGVRQGVRVFRRYGEAVTLSGDTNAPLPEASDAFTAGKPRAIRVAEVIFRRQQAPDQSGMERGISSERGTYSA